MIPGQPELWMIQEDGSTMLVSTYAAVPAGYSADGSGLLDANQNFFQEGGGPVTFEDVIIRRAPDGVAEVAYTEASNPLVKLHISAIVTGP